MKRFSELSVAARQTLLALISALAVLVCVAVGLGVTSALTRHSEKAFVAKDVVADILPPPMYLIELRLVLSQAAEGSLDAARPSGSRARAGSGRRRCVARGRCDARHTRIRESRTSPRQPPPHATPSI